jgi:hypothetical protein
MSRSQGAANSGWPPQGHAAGEPDPRTGGRPAQRPQAPQYAPPQQGHPQGYPQQGYGAPQQGYPQQPAQPQNAQPGYHYPQQATPQYAPPAAPQAPQSPRQALSSLDSARNAQPTHDFDFPRTQPPQYARQQQQQPAQRAQYAPQDNPINAAAGYRQAVQQPAPQYGQPPAAPGYDAWPAQNAHDPYAQDYGVEEPTYAANGNQPFDALQQADWTLPGAGYGDAGHDPQYGHPQQHGYDQQQHGGALAQNYSQDEGAYEAEEPRRRSWTMRIAGAVVVAIGLGYGLAQGYKAVLGGTPSDSSPPVIASDASPAKEKPADPGGRQFSHTDSKVLGRLGENGAAPHDEAAGLSGSDADGNGARQVKTLVVGRDGSIAPPSAGEPEPSHSDAVSVPGLTVVDAFGSAAQQPQPQRVAATPPARQPEPAPVSEAPPQRTGMNVKTTRVIPTSTASIPDQPAAAPAAPKKQKVAAAAPANDAGSSAGSGGGANGYVVVLASVPASGTSRLDALRKFADMQQQYGPVLASKTPDVRETTLPGKGPYHRLLVGPPGSKGQANELCTQLKAYGYKDCWVTPY